jgi:hypothetical protein|tara:strand:+ start:1800 stop:2090 length:291 start_codon:yes stop_codon:yes gene_type:complete
MIKESAFVGLGNIQVETTINKGHDPEFWAKTLTDKICGVSETAPDHVRQQALAFKSYIYEIILGGIKNAIISDRTTIVGLLNGQGHGDMAKIIKEL